MYENNQPLQLMYQDPPTLPLERRSSSMHQRPSVPTNQVWPQEGSTCQRARAHDAKENVSAGESSDSEGTRNAMAIARQKRKKYKIEKQAHQKREFP